jgi:UDP-N-acetylmuramate dehydrogenase
MMAQAYPLQRLNTFGFAAQAEYFASFESVEQLRQLLIAHPHLPKRILGGGSNILLRGDVPGLVLHNRILGRAVLTESPNELELVVGAGENWHDLVVWTVEQGWGGLENLALIPGTVGAAPIQNIGAYGVELADSLLWLEAVHLGDGQLKRFSRQDCALGYRDSIFKRHLQGQYAIVRVAFRLVPQAKRELQLDYGTLRQTLADLALPTTVKGVMQAVMHIRQSRLPDPKQLGNAGSFFKNPLVPKAQFEALLADYPQLPHYPTEDKGWVKIPAAWLIEQAGWKGRQEGAVGVHRQQALVLVHYGGGEGQQLWALAQAIQASVQHKFGIELSPEVNLW